MGGFDKKNNINGKPMLNSDQKRQLAALAP